LLDGSAAPDQLDIQIVFPHYLSTIRKLMPWKTGITEPSFTT
jgi:hypothetical protein